MSYFGIARYRRVFIQKWDGKWDGKRKPADNQRVTVVLGKLSLGGMMQYRPAADYLDGEGDTETTA